jgi:hypothetical protein
MHYSRSELSNNITSQVPTNRSLYKICCFFFPLPQYKYLTFNDQLYDAQAHKWELEPQGWIDLFKSNILWHCILKQGINPSIFKTCNIGRRRKFPEENVSAFLLVFIVGQTRQACKIIQIREIRKFNEWSTEIKWNIIFYPKSQITLLFWACNEAVKCCQIGSA